MALSRCLQTGLAEVPKTVLPLEALAFGDENTANLLARAAQGDFPERQAVQAAVEVLSGPPREEAVALVGFLLGGEFTIGRRSRTLG